MIRDGVNLVVQQSNYLLIDVFEALTPDNRHPWRLDFAIPRLAQVPSNTS